MPANLGKSWRSASCDNTFGRTTNSRGEAGAPAGGPPLVVAPPPASPPEEPVPGAPPLTAPQDPPSKPARRPPELREEALELLLRPGRGARGGSASIAFTLHPASCDPCARSASSARRASAGARNVTYDTPFSGTSSARTLSTAPGASVSAAAASSRAPSDRRHTRNTR